MEHPALLQYSCDLVTRVMPVAPLRLVLPEIDKQQSGTAAGVSTAGAAAAAAADSAGGGEVLDTLLHGRPLLCLAFNNMEVRDV
jgi:hypothetical protein